MSIVVRNSKKEIKNFSVSEHKETLVNFSAAAVPKSSNKNWHLTNPEKEAGIGQILFLKNRVINFTCNFKAVTITECIVLYPQIRMLLNRQKKFL